MPKLSALIALILLTLASLNVRAEPLGEGAGGSQLDPAGSRFRTWEGFLVDLPAPPPTVLLEEVRSLREEMIERRDVLDNRIGTSKLSVPEVLIAIAVPGGSAYLIGKVAWHLQTKKALEGVTTDLAFLDEDLLAYQGMSRVYVIALAQGQ